MKALTSIEHGKFFLMDKPFILDPRAVPDITVGHEMVGMVEAL